MVMCRSVEKKMGKKRSLPKLDISDIVKMHPEQIDILKKQRPKIQEKLAIYRQTEQITK